MVESGGEIGESDGAFIELRDVVESGVCVELGDERARSLRLCIIPVLSLFPRRTFLQ